VLICYDVTNRKSFEKIKEWVDSIADNASANIKMVLVGNKIDLTRDVTKEEGKKLADSNKIPFFETSAKTDEGVNECIRKLITDIISDFKPHDEGIKLETKTDSQKTCAC
jgi:Ras-related protein Rab-1A